MISLLMNGVCKLMVKGGGVIIAGAERTGWPLETMHYKETKYHKT
jgi:hypothetical protein